MLTIFGSPKSSSGRCFWCLEEVGAKYDVKSIDFRAREHKSESYLKINPNGKVPTLTDGDFIIWESMAINFYLAEAHKPELLGKDSQGRALVQQWSFWALAELQVPIIDTFIQLVFVPEASRDQALIEKARTKIPVLLQVLDGALENNSYLVGSEFTLADLNVASVVTICSAIQYDISAYKNIQTWMGKITARPAFARYTALCK